VSGAAPSAAARPGLTERLRRAAASPNPLWIRELKQAARLGRTPIVLCVVAVLATLLIASIGGIEARSSSPAETGSVLFHTFFSLAYFVVSLVGPAVAANSVASEREGHTWEAVLLTGLRPAVIARGKFLAAFTSVATYIAMLAPAGALPFLFGGVTAIEVLVAFLLLFAIALVGVAFGLAISSNMASLRGALLVTLLLAFPLSVLAFSGLGVGLSYAAHDAWPAVEEGLPVWLPAAYDRAPFGVSYALFLIAWPIAAVALSAWFLYEATVANLMSATDDRSSGLKAWFLVATIALALVAASPLLLVERDGRFPAAILGLAAFSLHLTFGAFLFAGEPFGPSRRVKVAWERAGVSRLARFLGPGLLSAAALQLGVGLPAIAAFTFAGASLLTDPRITYPPDALERFVHFALYVAGFYVFLVGLASHLRARSASATVARVLLFGAIFAASVGPWIVAAVTGVLTEGGGAALVIAAPSPFYVIVMAESSGSADRDLVVGAGLAAAAGWAVVGLVLLTAARRRAAQGLVAHERAVAAVERALADEDAAALSAGADGWQNPSGGDERR
jgi:ABC-type transport system involved in multi-copper enzyme maturation permease subunit